MSIQPLQESPFIAPDDYVGAINYRRYLARTINLLINRVQGQAVAVGAAAVSVVVTFPNPFPSAPQAVTGTPSWNSAVHVTAITATTATFAFSAPGGGGGTLYVVAYQ